MLSSVWESVNEYLPGAVATAAVLGALRYFPKWAKELRDFRDAWHGRPAEPGEPAQPGVLDRLDVLEAEIVALKADK